MRALCDHTYAHARACVRVAARRCCALDIRSLDDICLEDFEDGNLYRPHRHIPKQRREPRAHRIGAPVGVEDDLLHRLAYARRTPRLHLGLGRL